VGRAVEVVVVVAVAVVVNGLGEMREVEVGNLQQFQNCQTRGGEGWDQSVVRKGRLSVK
jgi:hypothetical protein